MLKKLNCSNLYKTSLAKIFVMPEHKNIDTDT